MHCSGAIKSAGFPADDRPADKQINKIIAIAKYKFKWGRKAIFNYICDSVHDAGIRVTIDEAKHYKYSALLQSLSVSEKSTVIKRLEMIERRNAETAKAAISAAAERLQEDEI